MNAESRELLDHLRNVANTSTKMHEVIDPQTLRFLVAQIDRLETTLRVVTAERDALKAQLEQLEHETIIEVGNAIWDRDKAQEESDALQALTTWQPVSQALPARGTEQVLAVLQSGRTREVVRARYIYQYEVDWAWYDGEHEHNEANGLDYTPHGWHILNEHEGVYEGPIEFGDTVTHWMPMPALPEEEVTK